jgi:hypothetical protein
MDSFLGGIITKGVSALDQDKKIPVSHFDQEM